MLITVNMTPEEAYALRSFVVRANDTDIISVLGDDRHLASRARDGSHKLSSAIWSALGAPCAECGGPECDHVANYYCQTYQQPRQ